MIIFHEGLPRSGKSYEAAVSRIIPALKQGRKVFAYIEGLNHEKFAEITGLPVERVRELLIQIEESQVKTIYDHIENDALVIIDELQDFWPSDRKKLDEKMTKFITQHGHRGLDIVVMGQDHRDCHSLWKRRIDQMYVFLKQDAIGRPTHYNWTSFKRRADKFEKLNSGTEMYDPKYFGLYLSHTKDTTNKATYNDDRANIFKSKLFKVYVPAFAIASVFAVWYLVGFFRGEHKMVKTQEVKMVTSKPSSPPSPAPIATAKAAPDSVPKAVNPTDYDHKTYVDNIITQYRPRLAALVYSPKKIIGRVDFLDDTFHVKETFKLDQLASLGWQYSKMPYGLLLIKGQKNVVVTAWPLEVVTRVANQVSNQL
jgi:zona occludens toxin